MTTPMVDIVRTFLLERQKHIGDKGDELIRKRRLTNLMSQKWATNLTSGGVPKADKERTKMFKGVATE